MARHHSRRISRRPRPFGPGFPPGTEPRGWRRPSIRPAQQVQETAGNLAPDRPRNWVRFVASARPQAGELGSFRRADPVQNWVRFAARPPRDRAPRIGPTPDARPVPVAARVRHAGNHRDRTPVRSSQLPAASGPKTVPPTAPARDTPGRSGFDPRPPSASQHRPTGPIEADKRPRRGPLGSSRHDFCVASGLPGDSGACVESMNA
jgi:hypothetical protein